MVKHFKMFAQAQIFIRLAAFLIPFFILPFVNCGDYGTTTCTNGKWIPDAKLIGFGLSCPLPLDGKAKSKGKAILCGFKKAKLYDGKTVDKDKLPSEMCGIVTDNDLAEQCKKAATDCLKDSKDYFQDPKTDKEFKTWFPFFDCIVKWSKAACKK